MQASARGEFQKRVHISRLPVRYTYMQTKQFSIRSLLVVTMAVAVTLPSAIHYTPTLIQHLFPPEPVVQVPINTNYAVGPQVICVRPAIEKDIKTYPILKTPTPETAIAKE